MFCFRESGWGWLKWVRGMGMIVRRIHNLFLNVFRCQFRQVRAVNLYILYQNELFKDINFIKTCWLNNYHPFLLICLQVWEEAWGVCLVWEVWEAWDHSAVRRGLPHPSIPKVSVANLIHSIQISDHYYYLSEHFSCNLVCYFIMLSCILLFICFFYW